MKSRTERAMALQFDRNLYRHKHIARAQVKNLVKLADWDEKRRKALTDAALRNLRP